MIHCKALTNNSSLFSYIGEKIGISVAKISKTEQLTPRQSREMICTTGRRKKIDFWLLTYTECKAASLLDQVQAKYSLSESFSLVVVCSAATVIDKSTSALLPSTVAFMCDLLMCDKYANIQYKSVHMGLNWIQFHINHFFQCGTSRPIWKYTEHTWGLNRQTKTSKINTKHPKFGDTSALMNYP